MEHFVELFKALSDLTRLRILHLLSLAPGRTLCVCEVVDSLELPQYNISRHLRILKQAGLLRESKEGRWVSYTLETAHDAFTKYLYQAVQAMSHDCLREDEQRLQERLTLREDGKCLVGVQKAHLLSRKGKST